MRWSVVTSAGALIIAAGAYELFHVRATAEPEQAAAPAAASDEVKRGEYLATFGGCSDCHTPKTMTPQGPSPIVERLLSGFPEDRKLPDVPKGVVGPALWGAIAADDLTAWAGPWGISFAANLTPDEETGLGKWTAEQFMLALRTGKHMGTGRPILPPMPWYDFAPASDSDLRAIFAYLKSVKPVKNKVPDPVPPGP